MGLWATLKAKMGLGPEEKGLVAVEPPPAPQVITEFVVREPQPAPIPPSPEEIARAVEARMKPHLARPEPKPEPKAESKGLDLLGRFTKPKTEPSAAEIKPLAPAVITCPGCGHKVSAWRTYADGRQECMSCSTRR